MEHQPEEKVQFWLTVLCSDIANFKPPHLYFNTSPTQQKAFDCCQIEPPICEIPKSVIQIGGEWLVAEHQPLGNQHPIVIIFLLIKNPAGVNAEFEVRVQEI